MSGQRGPSTRSVHAGLPAAEQGQPFLPGPVLASAYHLAGDDVHSVPGYLREGKRFMTVAVGCTGGKHRSVAIAEEFARRLRADGVDTAVQHRDLGRE